MNLRRGRTDVRGGLRAATFAFFATALSITLNAHFTRVSLGTHISNLLAGAAFDNVVFFTTYLASEPYVRRFWPTVLISWQRLVDGQWRDSLVARDLARGLLIGALSALKTRILIVLAGTGVPAASHVACSSRSTRVKSRCASTATEGPAPDKYAPSTSGSSIVSTAFRCGTSAARAGWCQRS